MKLPKFVSKQTKHSKLKVASLTSLLFLIIISPILYLSLQSPQETAAWLDDSYHYRQPITFTHNAAITSPRAITFSLDTAELITNGTMQSDCDDTRFTDANGTLLPYDLTGTCNNASTTYEVVFPQIINGSNLGYVYYGNPSAAGGETDISSYTALTPSGSDPAITDVTAQEIGEAPIASWSFDEGTGTTTYDASSNANHGTITGATWQTEDQCISGKCLYFDGNSGYVQIPDPSNGSLDPTTQLTIEAWIRPTKDTGEGTFGRILYGIGYTDVYVATLTGNNTMGFCVKTQGVNDTCIAAVIKLNEWNHIAVTYTDNDTRLHYVNGIMVGQNDSNNPLANQAIDKYIGNLNGDTRTFNGFIDEIKIYPYARTAQQIKSDYNARGTSTGTTAQIGSSSLTTGASLTDGLVAYYPMDETTANTCTGGTNDTCDASGNGNDGAWQNAATNTTGKYGSGVDFDGGTSSISVTEGNSWDSSSDTDEITIACGSIQTNTKEVTTHYYTLTKPLFVSPAP